MAERRKTVLVVDDDEGMRDRLAAILRREYRVLRAASGEAALQMMEKEDVALMLLDVRLPGISGFEVLKIARENYPYVEVVVISATKDLDTAIEAMRLGAYHYISKDFELEGVLALVRNASERQDLNRHVMRLSAEVAEHTDREFVVGSSRNTREIIELVQKVARLSATVRSSHARSTCLVPCTTSGELAAISAASSHAALCSVSTSDSTSFTSPMRSARSASMSLPV